jgi:hypothetical protein
MRFTMRDRDGSTIFDGDEWDGTENPRQPKTTQRKALPPAPRGMNAYEYAQLVNSTRKPTRDSTRPAASRSPWATAGGRR